MDRMDRRTVLKLGAATLAASIDLSVVASSPPTSTRPHEGKSGAAISTTEQWGLFEVKLAGPSTGNPFQDVLLSARFTLEHRSVEVKGFYDGEGVYRVRFMPDAVGSWTYTTASSAPELDRKSGSFRCTAASSGNHGPVGTAHKFHFAHADGTPFFPFGTTTYAFLFTSDANAANSLAGMRGEFNKTRVCVLPKPLGQGPKSTQSASSRRTPAILSSGKYRK